MKMDIDHDSKTDEYSVEVKITDLKTSKDYDLLHTVVNVFSMEFDLDPEIQVEDLRKIVQEARAEEAESIIIDISSEGVEVGF